MKEKGEIKFTGKPTYSVHHATPIVIISTDIYGGFEHGSMRVLHGKGHSNFWCNYVLDQAEDNPQSESTLKMETTMGAITISKNWEDAYGCTVEDYVRDLIPGAKFIRGKMLLVDQETLKSL